MVDHPAETREYDLACLISGRERWVKAREWREGERGESQRERK